MSIASNAASVSSPITAITSCTSLASADAGCGRSKHVVFMYNAQLLQTNTNCPTLSVAIQSVMPHITHQLGLVLDDSKSPSIRCVLDNTVALCKGNYNFFAAIAK
jgi:hypothetical protein